MPGSSSQVLQNIFVKLKTCPDQQLQGVKIAAGILSGSSPIEYPSRVLPNLGTLGEFLLGKWQEEEVHERIMVMRAPKVT